MKRVRAFVKGSAAAVVGVGLLTATPILTLAGEKQAQQQTKFNSDMHPSLNDHGSKNAHQNQNSHFNDHVNLHNHYHKNGDVNVYVNNQSTSACGCLAPTVYAQGNQNVHVKEQVNVHEGGHGNAHVNIHENAHNNKHVNVHVNEHVNAHAGGHQNVHENKHVDVHVNEHVNAHASGPQNVHENKHVNVHVNDHVDAHASGHQNEHVNVHVNVHTQGHENGHVTVHVNEHVNAYTNVQINIHDKVQVAAYNLELALQNLGCTHSDYLFAYLQSVHMDDSDTIRVHQNFELVQNMVAHYHSTGQWSITQKQESLRMFISCASAMHLTVAFVDTNGHPCNVLQRAGDDHIVIQLKDQQGQTISTIPTTVSSVTSPSHVTVTVHQMDRAASSSKSLSAGRKFVAEPVISLPKTATEDPLWMFIGLALMVVGGLAVIPAVKLTNRRK